MADRIEREIEEILARLDGEKPAAAERKPVSILSARTQKKKPSAPSPKRQIRNPLDRLNPAALLFAGAGMVVGGLILSNVAGGLIWLSICGIVVFLGAFAWSFFRSPSTGQGAPTGHYWRDRYIEYQPTSTGPFARLKRRLRGR